MSVRFKRPELSAAEIAHLLDQRAPDGEWNYISSARGAWLWREFGDWALNEFTREHPGFRPSLWWLYESLEPRRRLGGNGAPMVSGSPRFPYAKSRGNYRRGVPRAFVWQGKINSFDLDDPPRFESEPDYLKRLGLFLPGEEERVPPETFEPVVIHAPNPSLRAAPEPPRGGKPTAVT